MGSSTKTVKNLGFAKFIPEDKDLYTEAINKTVGQAHTIDAMFLGMSLMNINKSFNYRAFEKLDGATNTSATYSHISLKEMYTYFSIPCVREPSELKSSTELKDKFFVNKPPTDWHTGSDEGYVLDDAGNSYTVTYSGFTALPTGQIEATVRDSRDAAGVTTTETQPGTSRKVVVLTMVEVPGVKYRYRRLDMDSAITTLNDSLTFLSIMYKGNFKENTSRYIKAMNAQLGIPQRTPKKGDDDPAADSFEGALANPEYKVMMLTYAVPYEEPYKDLIDEMYGTGGYSFEISPRAAGMGTTKIEFGSGAQNFQLVMDPDHPTDYCKSSVKGGIGTSPWMTIDGERMTVESPDVPQYMLPIEYFKHDRTMIEKYDDLREAMTLFVFAQKTVKLSWWQTGLFKIFTYIVMVAIAVYSGNWQILAISFGSTLVAKIFGAKIGAIFNLIMALYSFGTSLANGGLTGLQMFTSVANIASLAFNVYVIDRMEQIQAKAEALDEEMEDHEDEIGDMTKTAVNISTLSDKNDAFYAIAYESVYAAYDEAYDYDKMY